MRVDIELTHIGAKCRRSNRFLDLVHCLAIHCVFALFLILVASLPAGAAGLEQSEALGPGATSAGDADHADSGLTNAKSMLRQGKPSEAEAILRDYLRGHEDSAKAHVLLGLATFEENRPADSLAEFTRAAHLSPPGASELVVVSLDYVKLKDLPDADRWMSAALEKAPKNVAAWRYMGGIKYSENRFSEAIEAYRKCLELQPEDVLAEDGVGRSYEGLGRDEDAEAALRMALDWQSHAVTKYAQPLLHLGSLLIRHGQTREALSYLEEAEALSPDDEDVHKQLGEGYARLNQLGKAQVELEKSIQLSPKDSHLHWLLASVYRREGQVENAERESQRFSELVGSHSNDKVP
jgi:tetratricopeptide (TPR) repeat protein